MNILTDLTQAIMPSHRYCAYVEGREEDGPYGFGATRQTAIDDLKEQIEEAATIEKETREAPEL